LLLFTGDNGTGRGATTRFKGADFPGGKGSTTHSGHHVPLIVSWPAVMKQGRVNRDLISCADFLPTICAATGSETPANVDGVSFLPQMRGETGTPHEALYLWYSPRQKFDLKVSELAFDHSHKLYRSGELYDLQADPMEKIPLTGHQPARAKLQAVLDQYKDARPAELDRQFEVSMKNQPTAEKKKKKRKN
jgi:arylsulfatase A